MQQQLSTITAALALTCSAVAQDCLMQVRDVEINVDHVGVGATEVILQLDPPIPSLQGTLFSFDAAEAYGRASGSGSFRMFLTIQLIDDDAIVGSFGPTDVMGATAPGSPTHGSVIRLPILVQTAPVARGIDKIRLVFDNQIASGAPDVRFTMTGLGGDPAMRVVVWPGLLAGGRSPHTAVEFPGELPMVLRSPQVTDWRELTLPEPASLRNAAEILTNYWTYSTVGDGVSAMIETHLELDDGSTLVLDDTSSPSIGAPPPGEANLRSHNGSLAIDAARRAELADRAITKMRYRAHITGTPGATGRYTPIEPVTLWIGRCAWDCYADADESGELDFFDFLAFQNEFAALHPAADCDGSGALDFFDFLCFQDAFAAGCP